MKKLFPLFFVLLIGLWVMPAHAQINTFPWDEDFENGGSIPSGWTESFVTGSWNWTFMDGTDEGVPAQAHGGSYNATFYEGDYAPINVSKLITPALDLSGFSTATLSFWHVQGVWGGDQDILKVYYKTSAGGTWVLLNTYSDDVPDWTQRTINLSNLSSDYYIAFEGTEMYGYGVGLDDVNVSGASSGTITTGTISGSPFCAGDTVSIPYTVSGTFNAGNIFTAQLSDASGSFASPVSIGTIPSTTDGTIGATIPVGTAAGTAYRIRVTSSNPTIIGTDNTVDLVVNTVPNQPSEIIGEISPCQTYTESYSVTDVAGVTYTWATPADWTITAGQGTYSITVTVGTQSGLVQVTPSNSCGDGIAQSITATASITPAQPSAIVGDITPCQTPQTYEVTPIAGVTYTWAFPAGWVITSGQGTSTVAVTPSATVGSIMVTPSTGCGDGIPQIMVVTPEAVVAQPSAILGNATPCAGTSQVYSVTEVTGITYTWDFPAGWVITAGQSTYSVTVTASSTAGTASVTPSNVSCGNGTPQTISLTPSALPNQPVVSGSGTPCQGTSVSYSVTNVVGETYTWSVPGDWSITDGQGSSTITVTTGSQSGSVSVIPSNGCGAGSSGALSVVVSTVPAQPSAINGDIDPCIGSSQVYEVTNSAGVTYTWTLPVGWSQTAGGTSYSITVTTGSSNGDIIVTPSNTCGSGTPQTLAVTTLVAPTINLGSDQTICTNETTTLDAGNGFSSYSWSIGGTSQTLTVDGSVIGVGAHTIIATVTNAAGCSGSNDIVITVLDCSGLKDVIQVIGSVYPNPASENINIAFTSEQSSLMIHFYDATGRLVSTLAAGNANEGDVITVPVSQFTPGVYSLHIISKESIQVNSVLIQ